MSVLLSVAVIASASGAIDQEATKRAFADKLTNYVAEQETEDTEIAEQVSACFDEHPGARQNMPALVHGTLRRLNVQPANFKTMEAKVQAYIRKNSDRPADKKAGIEAEAERTRLFGTKKGQGGGVCRWSDVPVESSK